MVRIIMQDAFSYFFLRRINGGGIGSGGDTPVTPTVYDLMMFDPKILGYFDPFELMALEPDTDGT